MSACIYPCGSAGRSVGRSAGSWPRVLANVMCESAQASTRVCVFAFSFYFFYTLSLARPSPSSLPWSLFLSFLLSLVLFSSSATPQNPVLFASGNGGPDMGVTTRGLKERRVIRNYTFSFAEIVFTNCSRHTAAVPLSVLFFSFFGPSPKG